jgi:hypothetical protein
MRVLSNNQAHTFTVCSIEDHGLFVGRIQMFNFALLPVFARIFELPLAGRGSSRPYDDTMRVLPVIHRD